MKKKIDKEFHLTRGQYAEKLGKSKGSIIQLMRRGKLNNEYIIRNDWYYFRDPSAKRENKVSVYGPIYTPKKKYNRGNHLKANYPNLAFQQHNEMKRLAAAQYKVSKDVQDKLPKAIERIREEERQTKQKNIQTSISSKSYGGFISNQQLNKVKFNSTNKGKLTNKKGPYEV